MKRTLSVFIFVTLILSLCSCGTKVREDESENLTGVINLQMRIPDTFDVLLTKRETVRDVMLIVYEPLFNITDNFDAQAVLAEECVMADNARSAAVRLKSGVKWHNGDTFTADDVIYTVNKILADPESGYYDNVSMIESMAKTDSYNITFKLKEPYSQFKYALYFPIEHTGTDASEKFIGTGPFMMENVNQNSMMLRRFEGWHNGLAETERVSIQFLRNSQMAQESFSAGKLHALTADMVDEENFAIKEGMGNVSYPNGVFEFIGFNAEQGIFTDPLLRIAVSNAIDRESIAVAYSDAVPSGFPVMMSSAKFSPSYETTMFDQEYAQEVIFSAGWTDPDGDNKPEKIIDGETLELAFTIIAQDNKRKSEAARIIKEDLEWAGFTVTVELMDDETYRQRIEDGEYDAFIGAVYEAVPYDVSSVLSSDGVNRHGYRPQEMDKAIEAVAKAGGDNAFKTAYAALQSIYTADQPIAGLVFDTNSVITQPFVEGDIKPYPYSPYANIAAWKVRQS